MQDAGEGSSEKPRRRVGAAVDQLEQAPHHLGAKLLGSSLTRPAFQRDLAVAVDAETANRRVLPEEVPDARLEDRIAAVVHASTLSKPWRTGGETVSGGHRCRQFFQLEQALRIGAADLQSVGLADGAGVEPDRRMVDIFERPIC